MSTRMLVALLLAINLVNGCRSQDAVAKNATHQSTTVNDILQQQVLNNLAVFANNKDALPSLAVVGEGTAEVTDSAGASPTLTISTSGLPSGSLAANRTRSVVAEWKLEPCVTAGRLARVRCAFQFAFFHPDISVSRPEPNVNHTVIVSATPQYNDAIREMVAIGVLPTPLDGSGNPLTPRPAGGWAFIGPTEAVSAFAASQYASALRVALDSAFPVGWFGVGRKSDIPKSVCYVGHAADTYVWVTPKGMDAFSRFTISVLALASLDPPPIHQFVPVTIANKPLSLPSPSDAPQMSQAPAPLANKPTTLPRRVVAGQLPQTHLPTSIAPVSTPSLTKVEENVDREHRGPPQLASGDLKRDILTSAFVVGGSRWSDLAMQLAITSAIVLATTGLAWSCCRCAGHTAPRWRMPLAAIAFLVLLIGSVFTIMQAKSFESRGLLVIGAGAPLLATAFQIAQLVAPLLNPTSGMVRHRSPSKYPVACSMRFRLASTSRKSAVLLMDFLTLLKSPLWRWPSPNRHRRIGSIRTSIR
jgi:hypothetical protein